MPYLCQRHAEFGMKHGILNCKWYFFFFFANQCHTHYFSVCNLIKVLSYFKIAACYSIHIFISYLKSYFNFCVLFIYSILSQEGWVFLSLRESCGKLIAKPSNFIGKNSTCCNHLADVVTKILN